MGRKSIKIGDGPEIFNPSKRTIEKFEKYLEENKKKKIKLETTNKTVPSQPEPTPPSPKSLSFSSLTINSGSPEILLPPNPNLKNNFKAPVSHPSSSKPKTPKIKVYCDAHTAYSPKRACHSCNISKSNFARFKGSLLYVDANIKLKKNHR